jgi:uncharacterized protein YuzE
MRIKYDKEADAAYIYLAPISPGAVAKTYPCDPVEVNGMINLDFDKNASCWGSRFLGLVRSCRRACCRWQLDERLNAGFGWRSESKLLRVPA